MESVDFYEARVELWKKVYDVRERMERLGITPESLISELTEVLSGLQKLEVLFRLKLEDGEEEPEGHGCG